MEFVLLLRISSISGGSLLVRTQEVVGEGNSYFHSRWTSPTLSRALVKKGVCLIAQVYVCTERSRWRVLHGIIGTGTTIVQVFARYEGIFGSNEVVGMRSQHFFMVIVLGWINKILPKLF
ncbi:hypothetical protein HanRHA438_Chr15g0723671 [Helianthus annuus]|nr:hypothetical protein HanRHA438_Chr15g0723671 [Helianthus annuus]